MSTHSNIYFWNFGFNPPRMQIDSPPPLKVARVGWRQRRSAIGAAIRGERRGYIGIYTPKISPTSK